MMEIKDNNKFKNNDALCRIREKSEENGKFDEFGFYNPFYKDKDEIKDNNKVNV